MCCPRLNPELGGANQAELDAVGCMKSPVPGLARARWPDPLSFTVDSLTIPVMILDHW